MKTATQAIKDLSANTPFEKHLDNFMPFAETLDNLTTQIPGINTTQPTPEDAVFARDIRLQLVKNRTGCEKQKDKSKENLLTESKFIQSVFNTISSESVRVEGVLMEVEKYQERLLAKQKEELKISRSQLLIQYVTDVTIYPLGEITEQAFQDLLAGAKLVYEEKQKKEAEQMRLQKEQEEKDRLEKEHLQKENETLRLQKEAQEKEAQKILQETKEKQAKEKQALELKLKKEREEKEKVERELELQRQAKIKEEAQRQAAIEAELAKGDKQKMLDLIQAITNLQTKYEFKSKKHKAIYADVNILLGKTINHIQTKL